MEGNMFSKEWYPEILSQQLARLKSGADRETVLQTLDIMKEQFKENTGSRNKRLLQDEALDQYLELCRGILRLIPDEYLSTDKKLPKEQRLPLLLWSAFCSLKYGRERLSIRGGAVCEDQKNGGNHECSGRLSEQGIRPHLQLNLMEYLPSGESLQGRLRLDLCVDQFLLEGGLTLEARINGKAVNVRESARYTGKTIFGRNIARRKAIVLMLEEYLLQKENHLEFVLADREGKELLLPVRTVDYQTRITGELQHSWWSFGSCMVTLDEKKERIRICRTGRIGKACQEIRLLKEILCAPGGSKKMFLMRSLYWLAYPLYARRKIWITFDKLYKGGDCGEYFYKYMMTRREDGITPVYIIRDDVADYARLKKEGYEPSVYRSWKQRLQYLYADMIFATHSSVHSFCGFSKWEIRFLQDRLRCVNTCIQHGLSVQDLTEDSNRVVNNNKRYYCAAYSEIENLSKPLYDYDRDVLRLTGIPRYDGLADQDQRQILITPTWRSYIAMPAVMGSARPYNPEFKETDYYRIYQELLENERLSEVAAQTGYRIIYLLHPVISAQKEDFRPGDGVELVTATEISYEKILTQSSLMVTDYSGVQFDFAYMRKPVVYFHPPKLPPHYDEGGFFYDTQGFGEICTQTEELVECLCDYMRSSCALKPFYRERQDAFFAFSDHENCRRIFEDALQYEPV